MKKKQKRTSTTSGASTGKRSANRPKRPTRSAARAQDTITIPNELPVLPTKDMVAFPSVMMSLHVGRPSSIKAVQTATDNDGLILILAQRNSDTENPSAKELFSIGVVASIVRTLRLPDGRYKVLLQGIVRARVSRSKAKDGVSYAEIAPLAPIEVARLSAEDEAIINRVRENLQVLVEHEHLPEEMLVVTQDIQDPGVLADVIVAHYKLEIEQAQSVLEELEPLKRIRICDSLISDDLNRFVVSERIRDQARNELTKGQREFFLREQIKQIQRELGEETGDVDDLKQLRKALESANLPDFARAEALKQLSRLERMHAESSEYAMLRTYLEWVADLPWATRTEDRLDLKRAKKILDADHYGIEKAKDRILEYLAVRKLNPETKGPILCFVGPPGVGKTSLGRSIARALDRKFFRMSLGGVRDEAEIRGHRRTYVGALPGRILQGLKTCGSRNPVFVLDELDKVGADFRGDPSSALLEVLDPAQNRDFRDHYLNLPFDLSEILFVATANTMDTVPDALVDRLEVIFLSGYTTEEKVHIARKYLIPRQQKENGLDQVKLSIDESALLFLIERYTHEAGVRNLEREIGSLLRKVARGLAAGEKPKRVITVRDVTALLGNTKFDPDSNEKRDLVGLVRGLAWTIYGGEMMPIEASIAAGKGNLALTGQLGSVMQESGQAALFYARANAEQLGIDPTFTERYDIHIHVPGGATPKDGPSAGITIATALVSALTQRKVSKEIAMTGEITLRGNILPVGGLKEKALAALRYGIKKVIIPFENIKDIEDIPKEQRAQMKFIPVKHIAEVLEIALLPGRSKLKGNSPKKGKRSNPALTAEA